MVVPKRNYYGDYGYFLSPKSNTKSPKARETVEVSSTDLGGTGATLA